MSILTNKPRLPHDQAETARFFQAMGITADHSVTWQTFSDIEDTDGCPAIIRHGTLTQHLAELTRLNQRGFCIPLDPPEPRV
jgi:hypothetical protein